MSEDISVEEIKNTVTIQDTGSTSTGGTTTVDVVEQVGADIVDVAQQGPQGQQGDQGPAGQEGVQGPAGSGGDATYIHNQLSAVSVWSITHNLNKFPSVMVVDSADSVQYGDIAYIDLNHVTITFTVPFGGKAFLN